MVRTLVAVRRHLSVTAPRHPLLLIHDIVNILPLMFKITLGALSLWSGKLRNYTFPSHGFAFVKKCFNHIAESYVLSTSNIAY